MDVTDTYYAGGAFIGYGAQVKVGQGDSPQSFIAIPDIESITPGDMTTGVVDKTHLRSPGRHREKLATIRDSGAIALAGNYRPEHGAHKLGGGDGFSTTHNLLALWRNVTEADFEIELPVGDGSPATSVLALRGVITKYQVGQLGLDNKVPFTMEITPLQDYFLGPV